MKKMLTISVVSNTLIQHYTKFLWFPISIEILCLKCVTIVGTLNYIVVRKFQDSLILNTVICRKILEI